MRSFLWTAQPVSLELSRKGLGAPFLPLSLSLLILNSIWSHGSALLRRSGWKLHARFVCVRQTLQLVFLASSEITGQLP